MEAILLGFRRPIFVGLMYCVLSGLWIVVTDILLGTLHLSPTRAVQLSIAKGALYVIVSGTLIYFVLQRLHHVNQNLETLVSARTAALAQKQQVSEKQVDALRTFIDRAPVGLAMFDHNMCYLEASSRWCSDFGLDRNSIVGKSHYAIFPDLPEQWKEVHRRGLAGEVVRNDEDFFTDSNGKEHWLRWEVRPWGYTEDGGAAGVEAVGIIIFEEDVTEHHLLQRELVHAQKMEAVGILAGGVAHDFNNLLMIIRTRTELLQQAASDPEKVIQHADQILEASSRAASLTSHLLAFSRKQPQSLALIDINSIVNNLSKVLPTLLGADIELNVTPCTRPGIVHVDVSQLEQVILNLVVNARDAMPRGGRLLIETSFEDLDEKTRPHSGTEVPPGHYVVLSVTDTGCGMTPKTLDRIFEPFFTTKPPGKGTGLGLSTVYGIVRQSHGFVSVSSEFGNGTTFRVYLPHSQAAAAPATVPNAASSHVAQTATILLAEDQELLRGAMAEYLQGRGFNILSAPDGKSALQLAEKQKDPIHILLTDVVMPGMRGTELARKVTQIHPETQTICMSGYPGDLLENGEMPEGTFMQKPVDLRALTTHIQSLLRPT
ncbi:MAG: ATP-binding protein [Terriglobales bacterium]|jgi:PAS domain S-box-containing protein